MAECNVRRKNFGLVNCNTLPGLISGMITTPEDFKITDEQAAQVATWQNAMIASLADRIYYWPPFAQVENISQEATYEDTPLAYLPIQDGNYRFRFSISQNLCIHKAMFTHRSSQGRAFLYDRNGMLTGTRDANGFIRGLRIQLLHTEKLQFNDGSVSTKSPLVLALADNVELDRDGVIFDGSFVNTLERIHDVEIKILSAAANEIVCTVKIACDGTPLEGLESADFVLLDEDGNAQMISSATDDGDGRYTLSGSGWESGTLGLKDVDQLSLQYYEAEVATVTIT